MLSLNKCVIAHVVSFILTCKINKWGHMSYLCVEAIMSQKNNHLPLNTIGIS